jgi:hypothetical protein
MRAVSRRAFLGWSSLATYGAATLLRPPHAHAGPKKKVFPGVAVGSGAAFNATVAGSFTGSGYDIAYETGY